MASINVPVLNALIDYMNGNSASDDNEKIDLNILKMLLIELKNDFPYFNVGLDEVSCKTQLSKRDQIRIEVNKKNIKIDAGNLRNISMKFTNWKFDESKILSMIMLSYEYQKNEYQKNEYQKYNIIISLSAVMNEFNIGIYEDDVSKSIIHKICWDAYRNLAGTLDMNKLFESYSELIIDNFYTKTYPSHIIKAYDAQKRVMDLYKQSLTNNTPLCLNYSTETGSGKTYLSLALLKANVGQAKQETFIFVCYNITVLNMISDICNYLNLPACSIKMKGVLYNGGVGPVFNLNRCAINIKAKNANSNSRKNRVMHSTNSIKQAWTKFDAFMNIGSDYDKIINQFQYIQSITDHNNSFCAVKPVIYICDPESAAVLVNINKNATVFLDEPDVDSEIDAKFYADILKLCPKRTIITSATVGNMDNYAEQFSNAHIDAVIATVNTGTSGIHSTMITNNGSETSIILPHMYFDLTDEKQKTLFIDNLKNGKCVKMYSPLAIAKMVKTNLNHHFSFLNLNYNEIRKFIIYYFENYVPVGNYKYCDGNITKPFTSQTHLLRLQTLCISNNPYNKALAYEDNLFGNYDIVVARKKYILDYTLYMNELNKIRSNKSKSDDVDQIISQHTKNEPTMHFPANSIIGCSSGSRQRVFTPSDDLFKSTDYELIKWLYAGVGFYDNDNNNIYTSTVLKAAEKQELAFLLSIPELVRGMDYRFDAVMLDDEFVSKASKSAIIQTIGRVGRPGSSSGIIMFETDKHLDVLFRDDNEIPPFKKFLERFIVEKVVQKNKPTKFTLSTTKVNNEIPKTHKIIEIPDNWDDEI